MSWQPLIPRITTKIGYESEATRDTPEATCAKCCPVELWLWDQRGGATLRPVYERITSPQFATHAHNVALIFAKANQIHGCQTCRPALSTLYSIPDVWWSEHCRKGNGYFGSQDIVDASSNVVGMGKFLGSPPSPVHGFEFIDRIANSFNSLVSWSRFLIKNVDGKYKYYWLKLNVFTHWLAATASTSTTNRQTILVFDTHPSIKERLTSDCLFGKLQIEELAYPFWVYHRLLDEVLNLLYAATWKARDQVRNVEMAAAPFQQMRFDHHDLHELSRHMLHVVERAAVTKDTFQRIKAQHSTFMEAVTTRSVIQRSVTRAIHGRLLFYEQSVASLHYRASSMKERLGNEIQLSFNSITQRDAAENIAMGRVMRTIALITLIFLPATFISALFSMSFFNYSPERQRWGVSDMFWVYWIVALPVTGLVLWFQWDVLKTTLNCQRKKRYESHC